MGGAFAWGLLAGSSLVLGALVAFFVRINLRTIGLVMGFGAGVLISAVVVRSRGGGVRHRVRGRLRR